MINRIETFTDLNLHLRDLVTMYQSCFAEAPWHEVFTEQEVKQWFKKMLSYQKNIILFFMQNDKVIGATFTFPVKHKKDMLLYLPSDINIEQTLYLAEMFVSPDNRRQKIATQLHNERIKIAKQEGFIFAVQRTHRASNMFPLIQKHGFRVIAKQNVKSSKNKNGEVFQATDERVISFCQI